MPGQQFAQGAGPKAKRGFGPGNTNPTFISTPSFSFGALPSQGVGDGSLPDPSAPPPVAAEPAGAAPVSESARRAAERERRRRAVSRNAVSSTQATTGGFSAAKTLLGQ